MKFLNTGGKILKYIINITLSVNVAWNCSSIFIFLSITRIFFILAGYWVAAILEQLQPDAFQHLTKLLLWSTLRNGNILPSS